MSHRLLALLIALCALPAAARTLEEIRQTSELRACIAGSSTAFYQSNAEAFARSLGVRAVIVRLDKWDEQFQNADGVTIQDATYESHLLASGRCDVFPNDLHIVDWRRSKMLLVPYYTTRKVIVAHTKLRQQLKSPADLAGRHAVVQKGTAYESWLQQQNEGTFKANPIRIELAPTAESMKRVSEGKADFSVIGAEGAFKWTRGELPNLDLLFPVDERVEVGWGISPRARDLKQAIERFFAESQRVASQLDRAWQKQYGISRTEYQLIEASFAQQGAFDFKAVLAWVIPLGSGILGVLLAMSFWTWRLKREIRERERTAVALRESRDTIARESARRLAQSEVIVHLQRATTERDFAQTLLSALSRHLPIGQSIFCRWDEEKSRLRPLAHYAGDGETPAESHDRFPNGGLIDRCLATAAPLVVEQTGASYPRIRSGLGDCAPAAILLFPIRQLGRIRALLEIATLRPFDVDHRLLLDDLEPMIALSLERLPALAGG